MANTVQDGSNIDVLVVGGGFAGCRGCHTSLDICCPPLKDASTDALYRLRKQGYNTKLFEAGAGLAGIWRNAKYPGARVDSELPLYGFKFPEVYKTWNWSQRYPDFKE